MDMGEWVEGKLQLVNRCERRVTTPSGQSCSPALRRKNLGRICQGPGGGDIARASNILVKGHVEVYPLHEKEDGEIYGKYGI